MTLVSLSSNRRKLVVHVDSPDAPPAYALVDFDAGSAAWLGAEYVDIEESVAPMQPVAFRAADGLALGGYLILPEGRPVKAPEVLFRKVKDTQVAEWRARFGGPES